jgi:hypothetical protein
MQQPISVVVFSLGGNHPIPANLVHREPQSLLLVRLEEVFHRTQECIDIVV